MKANHVPVFLVRKFFTQIFCFINVQLFNALLLRRECCSFSNGEYIKTGLSRNSRIGSSTARTTSAGVGGAGGTSDKAVQLLVIHQKPKKALNEITLELCPVLSIQQLYRISTMYWDDKYGTETVSQEVLHAMKELMMKDQNTNMSNSFLLDDDSAIHFTVDDIYRRADGNPSLGTGAKLIASALTVAATLPAVSVSDHGTAHRGAR